MHPIIYGPPNHIGGGVGAQLFSTNNVENQGVCLLMIKVFTFERRQLIDVDPLILIIPF